jgi:hypothetical protein
MTLAKKGILNGRPNGTFDKSGDITIGEVIKIIACTFDAYGTGKDYPNTLTTHWSNEYFLFLVKNGIIKSSDSFYKSYKADTPATREQCSILLSRVLEVLHDVK